MKLTRTRGHDVASGRDGCLTYLFVHEKLPIVRCGFKRGLSLNLAIMYIISYRAWSLKLNVKIGSRPAIRLPKQLTNQRLDAERRVERIISPDEAASNFRTG